MKRAVRDRQPDLEALLADCRRELERGAARRAGLHLVCELLRREVPLYDWVGFYLVDPEEGALVLGPFSGRPTERLRIPRGGAVAGDAGERHRIALPLRSGDTVIAFIVVESNRSAGSAAFTDADERFLEQVAASAAPYVPPVPRL